MKLKVYMDSEFNQTSEPNVNPVCCSFLMPDGSIKSFWHFKCSDFDKQYFVAWVLELSKTHDIVSFNVESEARYLRAMGVANTPLVSIDWIDLYLEWRMLLNHNHKLYCGEHLDGKVTPFKGAPSYSLAGAIYRLLGIRIDAAEKKEMRDLIISNPPFFTSNQQERIMRYCDSDVTHLPNLLIAMLTEYKKLYKANDLKNLRQHILTRANYAARTAIMVDTGYPIDYEKTLNFSKNTSLILYDCISDIMEQFPDIEPFRWVRSKSTYTMNTKNIKQWIKDNKHPNWELTETGDISLSLDAWTKYYDYKHTYPRGNFPAQMVRLLKLKQSLNGFMPRKENAKSKSFFEFVGSDGRVRPFLNIYGAQSGRSQPSASGFIPLKAAWMRSLIQAKPGKAICGIDYSSQEFLLAALCSNDHRMIKAYESGDVYLAFAKDTKMVPKDATKASHPAERNLAKSSVLGISYMMSCVGLSHKLSQDSGKYVSEEDAQKIIDMFEETYERNTQYKEYIIDKYRTDGYLQLSCGWTMFGDNENFRSVGNFPIQGLASSIMRKAVSLAQDRGLNIIFTLHDALYIEFDSSDIAAIDTLRNCMDEAFRFYMPEKLKALANCRMDAEAWSPDYTTGIINTPAGYKVSLEKVHIDERAVEEYKQFSKYFSRSADTDREML